MAVIVPYPPGVLHARSLQSLDGLQGGAADQYGLLGVGRTQGQKLGVLPVEAAFKLLAAGESNPQGRAPADPVLEKAHPGQARIEVVSLHRIQRM